MIRLEFLYFCPPPHEVRKGDYWIRHRLSVRPSVNLKWHTMTQSLVLISKKKHHYIIKAGDSRATRTLVLNSNEFPRCYYYQPPVDIEYSVYLLLNAYHGAQSALEHGVRQNPDFWDCPAYPKRNAIAKSWWFLLHILTINFVNRCKRYNISLKWFVECTKRPIYSQKSYPTPLMAGPKCLKNQPIFILTGDNIFSLLKSISPKETKKMIYGKGIYVQICHIFGSKNGFFPLNPIENPEILISSIKL